MRAAVRICGLVFWLLACLPPHLLSRLVAGRSRWPRRFLAGCGWIVGARVTVLGEPTRPPSLLLANHLSWIDILVLAGATGCAFVSKDDIGHPILRWLADQNATLYVRRSERGAVRGQASMIAEALRAEQPVTLFPEGTVGPGDALLPFRSSLLEAVALAPANVAVQPVALDYGSAATHISWHGESGADNVRRVLGRKGVLPVTVRLLEPLARLRDRKQLAASAHAAIAAALDASSPAASRL